MAVDRLYIVVQVDEIKEYPTHKEAEKYYNGLEGRPKALFEVMKWSKLVLNTKALNVLASPDEAFQLNPRKTEIEVLEDVLVTNWYSRHTIKW